MHNSEYRIKYLELLIMEIIKSLRDVELSKEQKNLINKHYKEILDIFDKWEKEYKNEKETQ